MQVSVVNGDNPGQMMEPNEDTSSEAGACSLQLLQHNAQLQTPLTGPLVPHDNLRFHPRCGILVKLSNNHKSAERARPLDDYNNGVVMTHRPLLNNEFFEIRIDKLVDKWSGSIEVGVTAHNPAIIRFPSTMTNMDTGTIMMSGCKVLMNGQGACMEYGNYNLDELREGDSVGMMKKSNGNLHFFINRLDQGIVTDKVPHQVWGVVDLYGMTVKVTIVDPCEGMDRALYFLPARMPSCLPVMSPPDGMACAIFEGASGGAPSGISGNAHDGIFVTVNSGISVPGGTPGPSPETSVQMPAEELVQPTTSSYEPPGCSRIIDEGELLFHTLRDSLVIIINDGRTAHRPDAFEVFNNGIVMTNRTLKTNELFQVRLDLVIPKWTGSIEIGITQYSSNDLKLSFPRRMINATSGTWGLTGENVIRNGSIIIPQYVRNLSRLEEGDTVGVMRKDMGILHFFVNGIDQGPAAFNIPEHVFGIIDLYGRAAQATIVYTYTPLAISSPESPVSFDSNVTVLPEKCFHRVHGHNARLSRNRLTASRATVYSEFNDAVLFSSHAMRECDMFEIRIDKMVDCWIGSLEIGVTAIRPDDLEDNGGLSALAGTATDLSWDTYILSGSAMMKDGECMRSGYPLDLDTLTVGSRVGMMWHADRSLHYYLDGMDMGKTWYLPHLNIYAVVDLYGQCTQVTILQNEERAFNYNGCSTDHGILANPRTVPTPPPPYWSFSEYHGNNVTLSKDSTVARRVTPDPMGTLLFSSAHLIVNELYEIQILQCKHSYAGCFRIGVTDVNVLNANINRHLPLCASWLPHFTAFIDGKYITYSRPGQSNEKDLRSFVPSFEWLRTGDRIALKRTADSKVLVYYNSELLEVAFEKVPDKVYVVMELYGITTKIQTIRGTNVVLGNQSTIPNDKPDSQAGAGTSDGIASILDIPRSIEPNALSSETDEPAVPNPPAPDQPDDPARDIVPSAPPLEEDTACSEPVASTSAASPIREVVRQRRAALPYTFHFLTGNNIRLCSSDTVALRFRGYSDAVAVASQPLRRGQAFRFRVDKVTDEWEGTVCIGALAMLPTEMPPSTALHFAMPCWVVTNDVLYTRGVYTMSEVGRKLEEITENSVLTLHFRFNSELTLETDGVLRGVIATIPRGFNDIYPTIDLYGRIVQVSILLHPHVVLGGTSLDLPMIEEKREEVDAEAGALTEGPDSYSDCDDQGCETPTPDSLYNPDTSPSDDEPDDYYDEDFSYQEVMRSRDLPYSEDREDSSTNADDVSNPIEHIQEIVQVYERYELIPEASADATDSEIKAYQQDSPLQDTSIQQSSLYDECVADNDLAAESRGLKKCHSTQNLSEAQDTEASHSDDSSSSESFINPLGLGLHIFSDTDSSDEAEDLCDTNIRHNDRYPEANEHQSDDGYDASDAIDDHLDNVFTDAMFLETTNMPDLNEEQSLSVDESTTTRRDDYWADGLTVENLHYLNGIICWDQRVTGAMADLRDWVFYSETNGNCEVMHQALKFWNQIVAPYSDMREVVTGGNVHCFCVECHPDSDPSYRGWVRVERAKAEDVACSQPLRMYWHVMRATVTSALALSDVTERTVRRPHSYCTEPSTSPACADTWIDEEGKPHQAALALDVDIGGQDAESDRLLAYWIYLKSHASMMQEMVEDIDDSVEDTVEDILDGEDLAEGILDDSMEYVRCATVALMDDFRDLDDDSGPSTPTPQQ